MRHWAENRSIKLQNFCSRRVTPVAITRILPLGWRLAAGFRAGSMPMITRSPWAWRSSKIAAAVAVLHATTTAFTACSQYGSRAASVSSRTCAVGRVP